MINHAPAVGQLESMVQEHEPIGVLLADKQRAQLYVFELGRLVDRSELLDELPRDYDSRGERERGTPAHHREELAHQHLRHAARAAFDLWQARGFHHLAIGAPDAIAERARAGPPPVPPRPALRPGPASASGRPPPRCWPRRRPSRPRSSGRGRPPSSPGSRRRRPPAAAVSPACRHPRGPSERRVERLVVSKGYAEEGWRAPGTGALALVGPATPTPAPPMERVERRRRGRHRGGPHPGHPGHDLRGQRRPRRARAHRRPAPLLTSRGACCAAVGLDVGGTKVLGVAVDPRDPGTVLAEDRVPTPDGGDGPRRHAPRAGRALGAGRRGVGVGVPGLVDRSGTLHMGPHLRRMHDVPLARAAVGALGRARRGRQRRQLPRRGRAGGRGGGRGSTRRSSSPSAPGSAPGIITGGRLLRGANGFAGEPGHMVVDPNGPPCPCGKRGCWERFASGTGLGRLARDAASGGRLDAAVALAGGDPEAVRGEHVTASARAGDAEAQAVLDALARWIALGLANLVNVLDPEVIVIGGGLVEAADLLLPEVRSRFADLVLAGEQRPWCRSCRPRWGSGPAPSAPLCWPPSARPHPGGVG